MGESNLEMVNTLTQQMGTIFNPLITNQTYELLSNQMGRITDFFGTPQVQARPNPHISNVRKVEMPKNRMTLLNLCQHKVFDHQNPPQIGRM